MATVAAAVADHDGPPPPPPVVMMVMLLTVPTPAGWTERETAPSVAVVRSEPRSLTRATRWTAPRVGSPQPQCSVSEGHRALASSAVKRESAVALQMPPVVAVAAAVEAVAAVTMAMAVAFASASIHQHLYDDPEQHRC